MSMITNFTKSTFLLGLSVCLFGSIATAQSVNLFSENMGSPPVTTSIAVNTFQNSAEPGITYVGTGDVRTTSASAGYATASGNGNVMLNDDGEYFSINGINIDGYDSLTIHFGIKKGSNAENGSGFHLVANIDGAAIMSFSPTLPTGGGTSGGWYYSTMTLPLLAKGSVLNLNFYTSNIVEFRIDDVLVVGRVAPLSLNLVSFTGDIVNDNKVFSWMTTHEEMMSHFELEGSEDGKNFKTLQIIQAANSDGGATYETTLYQKDNNRYYRLKIVEIEGDVTYSKTVVLNTKNSRTTEVLNTLVEDNRLMISNPSSNTTYRIYNVNGQIVMSGNLIEGVNTLNLQTIPAGHYFIQMEDTQVRFYKQ